MTSSLSLNPIYPLSQPLRKPDGGLNFHGYPTALTFIHHTITKTSQINIAQRRRDRHSVIAVMAPLPLRNAERIASALMPPSLRRRASTIFPPLRPSRSPSTLPIASMPHLRPRQNTDNFVTETYGAVDSSPSPGAIVGIVLGSIAGFLLFLWLVHLCIHFGKPPIIFEGTIASRSGTSVVTSHRHSRRSKSPSSRSHSRRRSRRKSGGHRRETVEILRTTSHPQTGQPRAPSVIEVVENRRRSTSRPVVVPLDPSETATETQTTTTDDIIVVEPPLVARRHSQRNSGHSHRHHRRSSGYRGVHPERFAGGNEPVREVRRSGGH
ncbi:hypothetical protein MKZ38_005303 [Zalerion maritima]|uniref:Uncharacterized protein n=1 Tax=Zalerion maritima TaxID=339359 RepID=A0AAD5RLC1_9PEZI|nr:hypothetical protein MKZ38_005303 [Zalerion maritima]